MLSIRADTLALGVVKPRLQGARTTQFSDAFFRNSEDISRCRACIDKCVISSLFQRRVAPRERLNCHTGSLRWKGPEANQTYNGKIKIKNERLCVTFANGDERFRAEKQRKRGQ